MALAEPTLQTAPLLSASGPDAEEGPQGPGRRDCDSVGWPDFLGLRWINPLVESSMERQASLSDIPELAPAEDTMGCTRRLLARLGEEERGGRAHPLLWAVCRTFSAELLISQAFTISSYLLGLVSPFLLQRVLIFQEKQNEQAALSHQAVVAGIAAVVALVLLGLFSIIFENQRSLFQARIGLRMNSALRGTLLVRGLEGRQQRGTEGNVYNVLSFDTGPNIDIIFVVLGMWLFPVQAVTTFSLIFSQVAWATIPGLLVIIMAKVVCGVLLYIDGCLRDRLFKAKDKRLSHCNEGFNSIRTLQMLAWAEAFESTILGARAEELRLQKLRLWMQKMAAALDYSLTTIVTLVTLGYYVVVGGGTLKASIALPVAGLIGSFVGPFGQFPGWLNHYLVWRSAYERVNLFIRKAPEQGDTWDRAAGTEVPRTDGVASFESCTLTWAPRNSAHVPSYGSEAAQSASMEPLLADQPQSGTFSLSELTLSVRAGETLLVVGREGQGKSSFLMALMGQMWVQSGSLKTRARPASNLEAAVPSCLAEVATLREVAETQGWRAVGESAAVPLATQDPVILSGTVRSNILLAARHEPALYTKVLSACALQDDLATMPAGDLTQVTSGGSTLSGGQRARIGLARAVYKAVLEAEDSKNPLVLLDDPFSALDEAVATSVCRALLLPDTGLLRTCTVVLACAEPWWISETLSSPASLCVAVLRTGRLIATGALDEIRDFDLAPDLVPPPAGAPAPAPRPPKAAPTSNPQEDLEVENEVSPTFGSGQAARKLEVPEALKAAEANTQTELTAEQQKAAAVLVQEGREAGLVRWATYSAYFAAVGPVTLTVMLLSLVCIMVFQNGCSLWMAYWTSEDRSKTFMSPWVNTIWGDSPPSAAGDLLAVYAALVLCFTLSNFAGHGLEIIGGIEAARRLFSESLRGVFLRPFQWWDANPTGRVLNRFSEDVEVMDLAVTNIMGVIFGAVLYFLGHSMVLAFSNPVALALLPFVGVCIEYFARFYRVTIREVHRIRLVSMSTVYQDMTEAIHARMTMQAFGATRQALANSLEGLDRLQQVSFTKSVIGMWVGLRMGLAGYTISAFSRVYPVLQFFGFLAPQSAALVGFSITYSGEVVGIMQQFVMNFSDLEMQLISIERLREYGKQGVEASANAAREALKRAVQKGGQGLRITDLEVTYRQGLRPAVRGVSLSLVPGEAALLMGRTGAGKSSLLLAILQLVPYQGSIEIDGVAMDSLPQRQVRDRLIAVVPQQPVIFSGSLRWNLDPSGLRSDKELWSTLEAAGFDCSAFRGSKEGLNTQLAGGGPGCTSGVVLSQGQRQLLCAARALLRQPRVALLDEVTAVLPQEAAVSAATALLKCFKEQGAAVLLVAHQKELTGCADRVLTMSHGQLHEGK